MTALLSPQIWGPTGLSSVILRASCNFAGHCPESVLISTPALRACWIETYLNVQCCRSILVILLKQYPFKTCSWGMLDLEYYSRLSMLQESGCFRSVCLWSTVLGQNQTEASRSTWLEEECLNDILTEPVTCREDPKVYHLMKQISQIGYQVETNLLNWAMRHICVKHK